MSTKINIKYNMKHLGKGDGSKKQIVSWEQNRLQGKEKENTRQNCDPSPPYNGKLRLYSMRFCPFAHRAVLALTAKNIDFEIINIDLMDKPEWYASKSALAKVPALEIEENVSIYESLVVVQYLDDVYLQRPLLPKDPVKKAIDKIIVEAAMPLQTVLIKLLMAPDTLDDALLKPYFNALNFIQNQLQQRGTKFLDGEEPGYADYMIWPWFERLFLFDDERVQLKEQNLLSEYINNMWQDPTVTDYALPKDVYKQFYKSYALGKKFNYDALLEN